MEFKLNASATRVSIKKYSGWDRTSRHSTVARVGSFSLKPSVPMRLPESALPDLAGENLEAAQVEWSAKRGGFVRLVFQRRLSDALEALEAVAANVPETLDPTDVFVVKLVAAMTAVAGQLVGSPPLPSAAATTAPPVDSSPTSATSAEPDSSNWVAVAIAGASARIDRIRSTPAGGNGRSAELIQQLQLIGELLNELPSLDPSSE